MAGRIKSEDIALVREKTAIDEIIGEHVQLRNAGGGNLKGLCPFHDEKSPSFNVTPARGMFHCLAGETRVITRDGSRPIVDLAGTTAEILTSGGRWVQAPFHSFGVQRLFEIKLRRNGRRKSIFATDEHRWFLKSSVAGREKGPERLTKQLRVGDRLAGVFPTSLPKHHSIAVSPFGVARGITFGDGHRAHRGSFAALFKGKDEELLKWFPLSDSYQQPDRILITDLPAYFKDELPPVSESAAYLYGWLAGYFAADGCVADDGDAMLSSADPVTLEHVRAICTRLGIGTFGVASQERMGIDGRMSRIHHVRLMTEDLTPEFFLLAKHRMRFESSPKAYSRRHWVVEDVVETPRVEEVFCAIVDTTHAFALEDNILTGNCFGCGAGGDVIKFVQDVEHLDFTDAVERLAARANIQLRYEEGFTPGPSRNAGQRARLIAAHKDAAAFYAEQLRTPEAQPARDFLAARGFDEAAALRFGCGYAPAGWDALTQHLLKKGYTAAELTTGGLASESRRGSLIDRFRRRLVFPIKDTTGDVIGFGARKLFDDDDLPKYLNTPETPIFKKGETLFGIDLAKRDIAKQHRAVIVEGYTDVMACHLAGVTTAVATNGTAFGDEHVKLLRRMLLDSDTERGEVIFTFDGDNAGMKAAEKAFGHDQKFMSNTFVAVAEGGMDPCELRMKSGDKSVLDLVASRIPLVEFVLRVTVAKYDLDTAEGRVAALDRGIPLVAQIKDRSLRDEYARRLAGLVGFGLEEQVLARVRGLERATDRNHKAVVEPVETSGPALPKLDEGVVHVEREVLKVALQFPAVAGPQFDYLADEAFTHPAHQAVRRAVAAAGGTEAAAAAGLSGAAWTDAVAEHLEDALRGGLTALAVEPLKAPEPAWPRYADSMLARLHEIVAGRHVVELKSKLQRINPQENAKEYDRLFGELVALEAYRRDLRERAIGGAV